MLSVRSLLAEFDLDLAVEGANDASPIRWVHISELEDPTPFLSGGELLLTTGINLKTAGRQRKFVRRLAESKAAGLGLAVGLDHAELPQALIEEAEANGLPLFELPFELPFIAITEWASTRLINEGYAALERSVEVHARLEGLVLAEHGLPEIMRAIAESVSGAAMLLDERGRSWRATHRSVVSLKRRPPTSGSRSASALRPGRQAMFVAERGTLAGRAVVVPVPSVGASAAIGWSWRGGPATSEISNVSSPARRRW